MNHPSLSLSSSSSLPSSSSSDLICPGFYCGRIDTLNGTEQICGSCPRGYRSDNDQNCSLCSDTPEFYDWTYLFFMILIFLILQFYCIDKLMRSSRLSTPIIVLYTTVCLECLLASSLSLLLFEPHYNLNLKTCHVRQISDWYTLFYNPSTSDSLNCTQEAVYPLYSIVFVFYFLSLVFATFRHIYLKMFIALLMTLTKSRTMAMTYNVLFQRNFLSHNVYFTLYSIPLMLFIHSIFAGIIYYTFPYGVSIGSILSIAIHYSHHIDQSTRYLLLASLRPRNFLLILFHWFLHAFGIVSITGLKSDDDYFYFFLIPVPTLFYIFTSKFTNPEALMLEPQFDF